MEMIRVEEERPEDLAEAIKKLSLIAACCEASELAESSCFASAHYLQAVSFLKLAKQSFDLADMTLAREMA